MVHKFSARVTGTWIVEASSEAEARKIVEDEVRNNPNVMDWKIEQLETRSADMLAESRSIANKKRYGYSGER